MVDEAENMAPDARYILAIDPGPTASAYCLVRVDSAPEVLAWALVPNEQVFQLVDLGIPIGRIREVVIENIESFGKPVGIEVFETAIWIGRFTQHLLDMHPGTIPEPTRIGRREIKLTLCEDTRAKDAHIRQALLDRFGGKTAAIGSKKSPGPLYGVSGHGWAALALAITYLERSHSQPRGGSRP